MSDVTTTLATLGTSDGLELLTTRIGQMHEMGKLLHASGLCPSSVKNPEAAVAIVLAGRELGFGVMQSLRSFHVIEGKPVMEATAQLTRAIACGVEIEWVKTDEKQAILKLSRNGKSFESKWTIAMAERAGLTQPTRNGKESNWVKSPEAMLRARAITTGIRAFCPDVLGGGALYSPDEIETIAAQPAPAPASPNRPTAAEAEVVEAEVVEPPKPSHHETWDGARASFCAKLREKGYKYEDVADFCESIHKPRPSAMDPKQRAALLGWMSEGQSGKKQIDAWLAAKNPAAPVDDATAPEPGSFDERLG